MACAAVEEADQPGLPGRVPQQLDGPGRVHVRAAEPADGAGPERQRPGRPVRQGLRQQHPPAAAAGPPAAGRDRPGQPQPALPAPTRRPQRLRQRVRPSVLVCLFFFGSWGRDPPKAGVTTPS